MAKTKAETPDTNTEFVEEPTPQQSFEQPSLTIQDLTGVLALIDVAIDRGAYKGLELGEVGQIYTKVNNFVAFLQNASQLQQAQQKQEEAANEAAKEEV